jgi:hypothetical protein
MSIWRNIPPKDSNIRDATCTYHDAFGPNKGASFLVGKHVKFFFTPPETLNLFWSAELLLDVSHAACHCLLPALSGFGLCGQGGVGERGNICCIWLFLNRDVYQ